MLFNIPGEKVPGILAVLLAQIENFESVLTIWVRKILVHLDSRIRKILQLSSLALNGLTYIDVRHYQYLAMWVHEALTWKLLEYFSRIFAHFVHMNEIRKTALASVFHCFLCLFLSLPSLLPVLFLSLPLPLFLPSFFSHSLSFFLSLFFSLIVPLSSFSSFLFISFSPHFRSRPILSLFLLLPPSPPLLSPLFFPSFFLLSSISTTSMMFWPPVSHMEIDYF